MEDSETDESLSRKPLRSRSDQDLLWVPVNSDEECIPRMRRVSSTSSDSSSVSSETSIDLESSNDIAAGASTSKGTTEAETAAGTSSGRSGQGNVKGWEKAPLSIMWCLNSFDIKESPSSDSRVILYDKKSVRALDHHPQLTGEESEEALSSPLKKRRKGRKKKKAKKTSGSRRLLRLHDDSEVGCQSCDSIESSPTRYKDDMTWTGYKIKKRRTKSEILQDQKSD